MPKPFSKEFPLITEAFEMELYSIESAKETYFPSVAEAFDKEYYSIQSAKETHFLTIN